MPRKPVTPVIRFESCCDGRLDRTGTACVSNRTPPGGGRHCAQLKCGLRVARLHIESPSRCHLAKHERPGPSDAGGWSHRCCRGAWLCSVGASQTSGEPTDQVVFFTDDRRAASRPRLALRAAQPGRRQPARPQRAQPCGPHGCAVRPPSASGVWRLRINGAAIRDGLWFEYDPCGDSAGLDVGDRFVDLVERSCFADHAGLAGGVELEYLAQIGSCADD
jgi:hypothetical protein